jgi:type IV pilus assembly protein PilE
MNSGNQQRGMTLIELLIVVTIIAILGAIAVPSYRQYILRSQRTEAKTALLRLQAAEEKFYLQNSFYVTTNAGLTAAPPAGLGAPALSDNGNYSIRLDPDPVLGIQGFLATATPTATAGQNQDTDCTAFMINHAGNRTATPAGAAPKCWR